MKKLRVLENQGLLEIPSVKFGLEKVKEALECCQNGLELHLCICDTNDMGEAVSEQGYCFEATSSDTLFIVAGGESGLMYALIDLAHHIMIHGTVEDVKIEHQEPFIVNRGIKFNLPLDARTPSYSDSGDSAQYNIETIWDFDFWKIFLDQLALSKYNALSLWNLHPFPSMVKVPGYEDVALDDVMRTTYPYKGRLNGAEFMSDAIRKHVLIVKRMTIKEKIAFWQQVMEYAKTRCIDIYLFTWNVFIYGTEHTSYGITVDCDNMVTKDYYRKSIAQLVKTYPLLAGIGITPGEQMSGRKNMLKDITWLSETYGKGITDALTLEEGRKFTLIHRLSPFDFFVAGNDKQENDDNRINNGQSSAITDMRNLFTEYPFDFEISFKYSQAHMYANDKPMFGDNFFQLITNGPKTWLTIRNDDFYLLRWGDSEFARRYLNNIPKNVTVGYFMGADGYIWGKEYCRKEPGEPELFINKMWYMFMIWGELSYQNDLSREHFVEKLSLRFHKDVASKLYDAFAAASSAIPQFQSMCFRMLDFHWYPEACCSYLADDHGVVVFRDINSFIDCPAATRSEFISIKDYCEAFVRNEQLEGIQPVTIIASIKESCEKALNLCKQLKGLLATKEYEETVLDIEALSYLSLYYAVKAESAIALYLSKLTQSTKEKQKAVLGCEKAYELWISYSSIMEQRYMPQRLTRFKTFIAPSLFNLDAKLDIEIAKQ